MYVHILKMLPIDVCTLPDESSYRYFFNNKLLKLIRFMNLKIFYDFSYLRLLEV